MQNADQVPNADQITNADAAIGTKEKLNIWRKQASTQLTHWREQLGHFLLLPDLAGQAGKELREQVQSDGKNTPGYMLMCGISAGIAVLGLLQGSVAVVIGAMLVSPLMSPIVALGFGFASLDGKRIKEAARVVMVGAAIGILVSLILTGLSPIRNATPEIIARTEPSLLDLLVALLSGVAGAYAVVKRLGAAAIGVAIATALMPPLATVGYGLATWRLDFAGGALLLFLTNLAAISFAITVVARISGAARPLAHVEKNPYFLLAGVLAFLSLATPLGLTLARLSNEAGLRSASQSVLMEELGISQRNITQLDVSWPLTGDPKVDAIVIAPKFSEDGQKSVLEALTKRIGETPEVNLQQIIAADIESQTRAIVDAAMDRTSANLVRDVPPFDDIRAAISVPVQSIWPNRSERIVDIVPIAVEDWSLQDYFDAEMLAQESGGGWKVRIIPPSQQRLRVSLAPPTADNAVDDAANPSRDNSAQNDDNIINPALAIWAIERWGLRNVFIERKTPEINENIVQNITDEPVSSTPIAAIFDPKAQMAKRLDAAGISALYQNVDDIDDDDPTVSIITYGRKPSQR